MDYPFVFLYQEQLQELFQAFNTGETTSRIAVGFEHDDGDVFHVYTLPPKAPVPASRCPSVIRFIAELPDEDSSRVQMANMTCHEVFGQEILSQKQAVVILLTIKNNRLDHLVFIRRSDSTFQEGIVKFIPSHSELYSRTKGLLETSVLESCKVAVVGLGSGGSAIAVELAKAGIGNFVLIDFDRLELANISRHTCGIGDLGRYKTKAVRDILLGKNPYVQVESAEIDINQNPEKTRLLLKECNLVVAATDNDRSRFNLNDIALEFGITTIFGRALTRASGGDVLRVRPNQGPCLGCVFTKDFLETRTEEISQFKQARNNNPAYVPDEEVNTTVQVGLSSDIMPISNMIVKLALVELSRGRNSGISSLEEDLVADFYIWSNRREGIYKDWGKMEYGSRLPSVLRWYGAKWIRNPSCPVCGEISSNTEASENNIFA
jgi:molybdopterin/thiamine biosynthesis adenylyltransferase